MAHDCRTQAYYNATEVHPMPNCLPNNDNTKHTSVHAH